jgi:rhamnosyltransferase
MFQTHQKLKTYNKKIIVLVPTFNPGEIWPDFLQGLNKQTVQPLKVVILDSESSDGSAQVARSKGHTVQTVRKSRFNHGGTRQEGVELHAHEADFVIFLTQDAILAAPDALENLLSAFEDHQVAAAYGRQLPHLCATPIAAHARLFNYPEESYTVTLQDKACKGIKTCFLSNSFAAYRLSALKGVGGFAKDVILGEDMQVAARLLLSGHAIRYQANASVYHSHSYSLREELGRYFDTGVFHAQQRWLPETFGNAANEGLKFMNSEIRYLRKQSALLLPEALLRNLIKYLGFKSGLIHEHLPRWLTKGLSLHKGYWV